MSRIGKQPVVLTQGVTITVSKDNLVTVKGPRGTLTQQVDRDIMVEVKDSELLITRPTDQIRHRAMHGLYRSLISNMVKGVTDGFKKQLELVGVGYKAVSTGNVLDLALGFSHNIIVEVPSELKVTTETLKGQNPKIYLEGSDNQLLGAVAAKIRSLRKPEPYKGKGVRYSDEFIRRKAGKAAGK
ncbi:MAG: 50S ribosomal protein L6 [Chitinophagaceae bacterium]|nr:50S ribosomal protein L6 [Chitinophagaceae bacterium]